MGRLLIGKFIEQEKMNIEDPLALLSLINSSEWMSLDATLGLYNSIYHH
jgi:hypothetical protein